jgi:protein-arginine kinase activator protein McsA
MDSIGKIIIDALDNIPEDTHEEYLEKLPEYKDIIDRSPYKFLKSHLKTAVKNEQYELAQYIHDKINNL